MCAYTFPVLLEQKFGWCLIDEQSVSAARVVCQRSFGTIYHCKENDGVMSVKFIIQ